MVAAEEGYNGTFIAYGQTGTGKSYIVFGEKDHSVAGLCSLVAADLFGQQRTGEYLAANGVSSGCNERKRNMRVFVLFLELYNERLRDLFVDSVSGVFPDNLQSCTECVKHDRTKLARCDDLNVVGHPEHGVVVPHLATVRVYSVDELERFLIEGSRCRAKALTTCSEVSSRSHFVVQFTVRSCVGDVVIYEEGVDVGCDSERDAEKRTIACHFLTARLSVLDLAGGEVVTGFAYVASDLCRDGNDCHGICKTRRNRDNWRREGQASTGVFFALGVASLLQEQQKPQRTHYALGNFTHLFSSHKGLVHGVCNAVLPYVHVPYRDSKLTRLLKESLEGNTEILLTGTNDYTLCV